MFRHTRIQLRSLWQNAESCRIVLQFLMTLPMIIEANLYFVSCLAAFSLVFLCSSWLWSFVLLFKAFYFWPKTKWNMMVCSWLYVPARPSVLDPNCNRPDHITFIPPLDYTRARMLSVFVDCCLCASTAAAPNGNWLWPLQLHQNIQCGVDIVFVTARERSVKSWQDAIIIGERFWIGDRDLFAFSPSAVLKSNIAVELNIIPLGSFLRNAGDNVLTGCVWTATPPPSPCSFPDCKTLAMLFEHHFPDKAPSSLPQRPPFSLPPTPLTHFLCWSGTVKWCKLL